MGVVLSLTSKDMMNKVLLTICFRKSNVVFCTYTEERAAVWAGSQ